MPGLYAAAGLNGLGLMLGLVAALADGVLLGVLPAPQPEAHLVARPARESAHTAPHVLAASRLDTRRLRGGAVEAIEAIEVLPPGGFAALHLPLLRGDPAAALPELGDIVLSRRLALKFFGSIDCLGRTLDIGGVPARVTAIAEDTLPATVGGFVSG